jgi:hypothetical protein
MAPKATVDTSNLGEEWESVCIRRHGWIGLSIKFNIASHTHGHHPCLAIMCHVNICYEISNELRAYLGLYTT